jgi:hypothetical protein
MSQPYRRNVQSSGREFQKQKEEEEKKRVRKRTLTIQTAQGNKTVSVDVARGNDVGQSPRFQDRMYSRHRTPSFIPPDTDRTQIVQKRNQRPVFVEGVTPLPPPITPAQKEAMRRVYNQNRQPIADFRLPTKEDVLSLNRQQQGGVGGISGGLGLGGGGAQYIEGAPSVAYTRRTVRKYISSLGKGASNTGSNYNFIFDESFKKVVAVRFVSISLIYVVPVNQPVTGFIYLQDFPKEKPYYFESAEGTYEPKELNRYQAIFPVLTGTVGATVRFHYSFNDQYFINLINPSGTINDIHVKLLKEDLVVTPGRMIDFSDIQSSNLELEFIIEKKPVA